MARPQVTIGQSDIKQSNRPQITIVKPNENLGGPLKTPTFNTSIGNTALINNKINTTVLPTPQESLQAIQGTPQGKVAEVQATQGVKQLQGLVKQREELQKQINTPYLSKPTFEKSMQKREVENKIKELDKQIEPKQSVTDIGKTIANVFVQVGKGIVRSPEQAADFILQATTSKYNPIVGLYSNKEKEAIRKEAQSIIQKAPTENFIQNQLGYGTVLPSGETVQQAIDKNSAVKSTNFAGQLAESAGGAISNALVGNVLGGAVTGSAFAQKAAANVGSGLFTGLTSGGSAVEQAYNRGATYDQASKMMLGQAAIDIATEYIAGAFLIFDIVVGSSNKPPSIAPPKKSCITDFISTCLFSLYTALFNLTLSIFANASSEPSATIP